MYIHHESSQAVSDEEKAKWPNRTVSLYQPSLCLQFDCNRCFRHSQSPNRLLLPGWVMKARAWIAQKERLKRLGDKCQLKLWRGFYTQFDPTRRALLQQGAKQGAQELLTPNSGPILSPHGTVSKLVDATREAIEQAAKNPKPTRRGLLKEFGPTFERLV